MPHFEHIEDHVIAERMVNINGSQGKFFLAFIVLIFIEIDGENVIKLKFQNLVISSPFIIEPKVKR